MFSFLHASVEASSSAHWHIARAHSQSGQTALICAATRGHADCVWLLLDAGADKDARGEVRASAGVGMWRWGEGRRAKRWNGICFFELVSCLVACI